MKFLIFHYPPPFRVIFLLTNFRNKFVGGKKKDTEKLEFFFYFPLFMRQLVRKEEQEKKENIFFKTLINP